MPFERLVDALGSTRHDGVGVDAWSLYVTESRRMTLGIKDREAGNAHAPLTLTESCGARYLLVWSDGKISRGFLERSQLAADPGEALAYARAAAYDDPDAAQVRGPATMPDVELHDAAAAAIAGGDTAFLARRLEAVRERTADGAFRTWSGSFSGAEAEARVISSAGLDVDGKGSGASWFVTLNGEIGDGFSARAPEPDERFEARLDRLIDVAGRLARPAQPMSAGTLPVILHPRVVEEYVLDTLLGQLDGATVAHGEGHFRREQFGSADPVLREDLSLRVDPLQPLKRGSYRFTVEGVPAAPGTYIERGRLIQPVLDLKYARRLGLAPTPLPYAMDIVEFAGPAPLDLEPALAAARGGALVLSVLGVHTQDSASGDFSLSAPQVLSVEADGLGGRLRATISGNLYEVLQSEALQLVRFDGDHTPGLLFPCRLDPR